MVFSGRDTVSSRLLLSPSTLAEFPLSGIGAEKVPWVPGWWAPPLRATSSEPYREHLELLALEGWAGPVPPSRGPEP